MLSILWVTPWYNFTCQFVTWHTLVALLKKQIPLECEVPISERTKEAIHYTIKELSGTNWNNIICVSWQKAGYFRISIIWRERLLTWNTCFMINTFPLEHFSRILEWTFLFPWFITQIWVLWFITQTSVPCFITQTSVSWGYTLVKGKYPVKNDKREYRSITNTPSPEFVKRLTSIVNISILHKILLVLIGQLLQLYITNFPMQFYSPHRPWIQLHSKGFSLSVALAPHRLQRYSKLYTKVCIVKCSTLRRIVKAK